MKSRHQPLSAGVFPPPITALPRAELPVPGARAYLSQAAGHQILFMEFEETVDVPEHAHASQWGLVLAGKIELTIGGVRRTFRRGGRYFIPAGVRHSARIHGGYADVTFFDEPQRYRIAAGTEAE